MELDKYDLEPNQQLAVSLYLKSMNKSQAAKDAGYESPSVFNNPSVKAAINEQLIIRAERLRVGADWVLNEAVKVYRRCMQTEKVLDRDGNFTGEYKFDANNALKALTLVGRHVDVRAFDNQESPTSFNDELLARLQRGRKRTVLCESLLPDSDLEGEEPLEVDCESYRAPELDEEPPVSFLEPVTCQSGIESLVEQEQLSAPVRPLIVEEQQHTHSVNVTEDCGELTSEQELKRLLDHLDRDNYECRQGR